LGAQPAALAFAHEGTSVTIAAAAGRAGHAVVSLIKDAGGRGLLVQADVAERGLLRRSSIEARKEHHQR
jgi:NAD(P)-dependent dehydrogenase (short-subunit alcohol dehydrogenase family)